MCIKCNDYYDTIHIWALLNTGTCIYSSLFSIRKCNFLPISHNHALNHRRDHTRKETLHFCQSFQFIFYLVKHFVIWRMEERPEHDGKKVPLSVSSQFKLKWPFVSALIGGALRYGRGVTRDRHRARTHAAVHQFTHRQREYSKYIHGMFWAISARDHIILPPHSDKISYISYFRVFSFIFPFWGSSRKSLASGKINKHLKRFHC